MSLGVCCVHLTLASLHAAFGVAMAKRMHSLQSDVEIKRRLRDAKKRKLKHGGVHVAYGEQIVDKESCEKWNWVSLFALPKEERHALYLSIDYKEECVNKPNRQNKAHNVANLKRKADEVMEGERLQLKKAAEQARWIAATRATSVAQLKKLLKAARQSESAQLAVLTDQIKIRKHVNQVAHPISKGYSQMKVAELQPLVEAMVKSERYRKPRVVKVPALAERQQTPHPCSYSKALDAAREERAEAKGKLLEAMIEDGSFMALLKRKPTPKAAGAGARGKRQQPTSAQSAKLAHATFEDEGIEWKVLKLEWSDEYNTMLVYYYDVGAVRDAKIDESDLDDDDENVEASSITEVLEWVKKSN
jgi:hypothetical protein